MTHPEPKVDRAAALQYADLCVRKYYRGVPDNISNLAAACLELQAQLEAAKTDNKFAANAALVLSDRLAKCFEETRESCAKALEPANNPLLAAAVKVIRALANPTNETAAGQADRRTGNERRGKQLSVPEYRRFIERRGTAAALPLSEIATPSQFIYKLNAMEHASQADHPDKMGYATKRTAVLAHIADLERELARLRIALRPLAGPASSITLADKKLAAELIRGK